MLIHYFPKHFKLKMFLSCAVVEFLFNRAVRIALLVVPSEHARDLILDLKMAVSLVLINRRDLLDRRNKVGTSINLQNRLF